MSLFGSIASHITGAIKGFSSGGVLGGIAGAISGGPKNPAKTKNVGVHPMVNATKGKIQLSASASPTLAGPNQIAAYGGTSAIPGLSSQTGTFSASGLVRQSAFGGSPPSSIVPALYGGAGSTGTFMPTPGGSMTLAPGYSPMAMYHRFYTKKGTLRRVTRTGVPYKAPHMNPMNPRAARRAIRRIRGARKLLQRIERSLPKARTHRAPPRRNAA